MAVRTNFAARNINGEFISPDARLTAFGDTSRYTLEITIVNAADWTNTAKSISAYIEYLDEAVGVWKCGGGGGWRGGLRTARDGITTFTESLLVMGSSITDAQGLVDTLRGSRVRIRLNTPAVTWPDGTAAHPGTSGTVRASARILDERAS